MFFLDQKLLEPTTTTPAYTPVVTTTASTTTTTTAPSTTERTTTTTPFTTETTTTTTTSTTTTSTTSTTTTTASETTAGEDYDGGWGDLFEATTTAAPTIVPSGRILNQKYLVSQLVPDCIECKRVCHRIFTAITKWLLKLQGVSLILTKFEMLILVTSQTKFTKVSQIRCLPKSFMMIRMNFISPPT